MPTSFSAIKHIARFEAKTLTRSWIFRIFAILMLFILAILNTVAFTGLGGGMTAYVVAGSVPYMNMLFLNAVQTVVAIFLSSDFIGRDKKLDTTEAFYVRSVSNFGYVLGKTLGIVTVFFFLDAVILLMGLAINTVSPITDFVPITYLLYPLLFSLPSLMLVLGLSFFLMTLIKNQAVTFILMLGLLGAGMFYFGNKWYGLLDIPAMNIPMAYSAFTGLTDTVNLLLIRGSYVLLGFGFIFFTVLMLPRLPQERHFRMRTVTAMLLAFIPAIIMLWAYIVRNRAGETLRAEIIQLEETLPAQPSLRITDNKLSLLHTENEITVVSQITAFAESDENISFIINNGFTVENIKLNGSDVTFQRRLHTVSLQNTAVRGETVQIEITYSGKPDERALFPEVPKDLRSDVNRLDFITAGRRISYVLPDYILLTREAGWYPVAASRNFRSYPQFTRFTLEARIAPHLTAFSQGQKESDGNKVRFIAEQPLNALSFVAGKYETRSLMLDSVEVTLALYPENMKFIDRFFTETADTIPHVLAEMKGDYERKLGISYPFKRFSLIEVPIHFYACSRNWTLTTDDSMPEQLLIPERGGANWMYDLKAQDQMLRWQRTEGESPLLPKEKEIRVFKNILGNMLFNSTQYNFGMIRLQHSVFPQYTTFVSGIEQEGFPAMQFIIENYLLSRVHSKGSDFFGFGVSNEASSEQVILKLKNNSLLLLLDSMKYDLQLTNLVSQKGAELFGRLQIEIEPQNIDNVLNKIVGEQNFELMPVDTFMHRLDETTESALSPLVNKWLRNTASAAFLFGETRTAIVKDGNRERFFVQLQVLNTGNGDGILSVGIREQLRNGGGEQVSFLQQQGQQPIFTTVEKKFVIPAKQAMEIGMISNYEPREIIINTFVSDNLPVSRRIQINSIGTERSVAFEGIRPYSGTIFNKRPYEYIVDNEDAGFSIINRQDKNTLKEWWMLRNVPNTGDKYKAINNWNPSHKWEFVLADSYYGEYIRSAAYIRRGTGENKVQWQVELPESGNYSVYVYQPERRGRGFGRQEDVQGNYLYTVVHDDGEETVAVEVSHDAGWHPLGDYYISKGTATVTLSDKTEERMVVADAVKWVKKNN